MAWETKTLGEVCEISSSNIKQKDILKIDGDYPVFGASGFIKNINFYHQEEPYISIVKDGSGVGRVSLMEGKTSVIGTLQYIIPKENINIKYLHYALLNIDFNKYVAGAAQPHIYFRDYKNESIIYREFSDQENIVSYLDDTFEKIEQCQENIKQNIINAKELFQSKLNLIFKGKEHWETKTLGEVCKTSSGGTPLKSNKNYYENGKIPWLLSGEVNNKNITTSANFITEEGLKNSSAKLFPPKTILIAMYGATAGQVGILNFECSTNQAVCGIYPNNKIHYNYIYYYFLNVKEHLKSQAVGNAQPNISQEKIKKTIITYPTSLSEQEAIVKELDKLSEQVDEIVNKYQQKLQLLQELKSSILEQVFTPKN